MKRGKELIIASIIFAGLFNLNLVVAFAGGDGSVSNPYQISTCQHLQDIQNNLEANFTLINDIDCSATSAWNGGAGFIPTGSFRGRLNGKNFKINSLYINRPGTDNVGLFGSTFSSARINSINLINVNIKGKKWVGGLAGANSGWVINCSVTGKISGSDDVGGITGQNEVTSSPGQIYDSHTDIEITGNNYIGGVAGGNTWGSSVTQSYSKGKVTGNSYVGGLVGLTNRNTEVSDSYSLAEVSGTSKVGGLVGASTWESEIRNCYSTGKVSGTSEVGGLLGSQSSDSYTYNSFWDTQTSLQAASAGGTGKTTNEMKAKSTFSGWDFTNVWKIEEGINYPQFSWQSTSPPVTPTTCPDNDRIMKLYSPTNSHGALWDDSSYTYDICYSTFFGLYAGENPHQCTASNKILELYQDTNSHAQRNEGSLPYLVDVCYGDLGCEVKEDPTSCDLGYQTVVRLYQEENSHISKAEDTSYPVKICCKPGATATNQVYWANMKGEAITKADIGDTVLMIYKNKAGQSFSFEVKEEDTLDDDELGIFTGHFDYNGHLAAKWTITQEDYKKGGNEDPEENFFFIVDSKKSGKLNVLKQSTGETDSPPNAIIDYPSFKLPQNQRRFKVNQNIEFNQTSWDVDDSLKITWESGDGSIINCYWPEQDCDTIYNYATSGTKEVYLRAEEVERSKKASNYTEVYIYDAIANGGTNVFAVMQEPENLKVFPYSALPIRFNASKSYVSKCQAGASCLADKPTYVPCYTVSDLSCYDRPKFDPVGNSLIGTGAGQYNLWFNWTFSNGDTKYGNWSSNYPKVVDFTKYFFNPQKYKAYLKVGYGEYAAPSIWSDSISKEFEVTDVVPICDRERGVWKWWDTASGGLKETSSLTSCYRDTGMPPICCPAGYECKRVDNFDDGDCVATSYVLSYCEDYTLSVFSAERIEDECNSAPINVAKKSIERIGDYAEGICNEGYREVNKSNPNCFRYTNCRCYWKDNNCSGGVEYSPWYCGENPPSPTDPDQGICILEKSNIEGNCEDSDFITWTWTRKWIPETATPPFECQGSKTRNIACPSRLTFFTLLSFFAAAVVITVIYAISVPRKKRGK